MSTKVNDVFKVLVTKDNQAVLAKDKTVFDLAPGQIGVFSNDTNKSIDGTYEGRDFYLAVGIDEDGDGTIDNVSKSSGSHIQKPNISAFTFKKYVAGAPMKIVLKDYVADCETEYGLKLEFRNQEIYRSQGYNQFTVPYVVKTSCCKGCTPTCPSGDANEITKQLFIQINNDPRGLAKAKMLARKAITAADTGVAADIPVGGEVSLADLEKVMAFNATKTDPKDFLLTDLEVETITKKIHDFCSVNLQYFYPRETVVVATKIAGFECNGTLVTTQPATFEQGSGYDIKQREYVALGWSDSPYRVSTLNGVAFDRSFNADVKTKYSVFVLEYDEFSRGGWLEYLSNEATIIAVPDADNTTITGLTTVLNALLKPQGFKVS